MRECLSHDNENPQSVVCRDSLWGPPGGQRVGENLSFQKLIRIQVSSRRRILFLVNPGVPVDTVHHITSYDATAVVDFVSGAVMCCVSSVDFRVGDEN